MSIKLNGVKSVDELTAEANIVRSKLLRTVEELERRRHDALDVNVQVRRHLVPVAAIGAIAVFAIVGAASFLAYHAATADQRRARERWRMVRRVWEHPERAARRGPTVGQQLARTLLVGVASTLLLAPVRIAVRRAIGRALSTKSVEQVNPGTAEPRPRLIRGRIPR